MYSKGYVRNFHTDLKEDNRVSIQDVKSLKHAVVSWLEGEEWDYEFKIKYSARFGDKIVIEEAHCGSSKLCSFLLIPAPKKAKDNKWELENRIEKEGNKLIEEEDMYVCTCDNFGDIVNKITRYVNDLL